MTEIRELERLASPAPYPQGLAVDGTTLWIGSCESHRLYAVDLYGLNVHGRKQHADGQMERIDDAHAAGDDKPQFPIRGLGDAGTVATGGG